MGERYELRVAGSLGQSTAEAFAAFTSTVSAEEETVLRGTVRDQAELHGLLDQLHAFGLQLVSVQRLSDEPGSDEPAAD